MAEQSSAGSAAVSRSASSSGARVAASSACDACRRRKLRCVGDQPCQRCLATGVNCTYGSVTARHNTLAYTRHLEAKVAELQTLLRQQPMIEPGGSDELYTIPQHAADADVTSLSGSEDVVEESRANARDTMIETLVGPADDTIYLTPEDQTDSFHGKFAGLTVLRIVRDLADQVAGAQNHQYGRSLAEAFDTSLLDQVPDNSMASFALLPSQRVLHELVTIALDEALSCQECMDRSDFKNKLDRLYDRDPEDYDVVDRRALALVYALLALGRQRKITADMSPADPTKIILRGMSYFRASRSLIVSMDCNNLDCIRTIICLANYLLSASMTSKAYTFACTGISAALRMGIHVYSPSIQEHFTAHELTQRRKVFAVLNFTQVYLASVLGMPLLVKDPDKQQTIPVSEEDLHDEGIGRVQRDPLSAESATILTCHLFRTMAEITKSYDPVFTPATGLMGDNLSLRRENITKWEAKLENWSSYLPAISPGSLTPNVLRAQLVLRFLDSSLRIAIYRPFLQHIILDKTNPQFDESGFALGSSCLSASMQAIWLANTMDGHNLLHHTQWYVIYNLAMATSSLMLFELGPNAETTVGDTRAAAAKARELLLKLSRDNLSARRCYESLDALQEAISRSQAVPDSPRTQFMRAIGALEHEE